MNRISFLAQINGLEFEQKKLHRHHDLQWQDTNRYNFTTKSPLLIIGILIFDGCTIFDPLLLILCGAFMHDSFQ
jgi:hypothetical protein